MRNVFVPSADMPIYTMLLELQRAYETVVDSDAVVYDAKSAMGYALELQRRSLRALAIEELLRRSGQVVSQEELTEALLRREPRYMTECQRPLSDAVEKVFDVIECHSLPLAIRFLKHLISEALPADMPTGEVIEVYVEDNPKLVELICSSPSYAAEQYLTEVVG